LIRHYRVLVNCPPLLLSLPHDQLVRVLLKVHARSFLATIRETNSRPNRDLCHRGSHNDDDHGCKIITLPSHSPLVVKNRSEAAARAFHSAFATRAPLGGFHRGVFLGIEPLRKLTLSKDFNQLTIDTISYILS
jgi:hypothetical protein